MKKNKQNQPISALDIAVYILANHTSNNSIAAWKMHKLVYYCQVWSLIRENQPFFYEKVMASSHGLMIHELRSQHQGSLYVGGSTIGNLNHLSLKQVDIVDFVIKVYGNKTSEELDELIHLDSPWKEARMKARSKENVEITPNAILTYYTTHSPLEGDGQKF